MYHIMTGNLPLLEEFPEHARDPRIYKLLVLCWEKDRVKRASIAKVLKLVGELVSLSIASILTIA